MSNHPLVLKSPDAPLVRIKILVVCRDCKTQHLIEEVTPDAFGRRCFDEEYRHRGHRFEFTTPQRIIPRGFDDRIYEQAGEAPWWLDYRHNANFTTEYVADVAFTLSLSALASSATWVAGQESTSVSNASNKYLDYSISGSFISGTTPASGEARLYFVRPYEDTPTWGGGIAGTGNAAATITNVNILASMLLGWSGGNSTSSNVTYPIWKALTMTQAFGVCPATFLVFFAHSQTAALKTDTGNNNNSIYYKGSFLAAA